VSPSFQVSRYGYREPDPDETPDEVQDDGDWIARMELPNGTTYPIVDLGNRNHSGAGWVAFAGDYIGAEEVPGEDGRAAFMVAFSDNRYNIWPWQTEFGGLVPSGEEWRYYPTFQAPDDPETTYPGVSCVNYGSRVQSVMAARVSTSGLLLNAPTNRKPFEGARPVCGDPMGGPDKVDCIEFPLTVRNNTGTERTISLEVLSGAASFAKRPWDPALDGAEEEYRYIYPLTTGDVTLYPYSSYSLNVYAFDDEAVTVTATAVDGADSASITFNDPAVKAASADNPSFTYVPSTVNIESGSARSGSARSGSARSGSARSGSARSGSARSYPVPEDPLGADADGNPIPVYDVIDYTYVVSASSPDDVGTYLSLFNIDPAYEGSYVFQVFVTKPLTSFMTDEDDTCSAFNWTEGALVGHISDPTNPLVNGSARSGSARSGSARSGSARSAIPSDGDPLVQNTSFTLGSSTETALEGGLETSTFLASASTSTTGSAEHCLIDECTLAAPRLPNEVTILVRAYQIAANPPVEYDPDGSRTGTPTPPSVAVAEYSCDEPSCTAALGPDLVVQTPEPAPAIEPSTHVKAGTSVVFPDITITNEGVDGDCGTAEDPRPCGDARPHEWAVYASTEADFDLVPRWDCSAGTCTAGQISGTVRLNDDPEGGPVTVLLTTGSHEDTLGVDHTEYAVVGELTIPASLPRTEANGTGVYYLHFYDDRGRIVNELDETNNSWTEGPIVVESPGYGFLGLQTPCDGTTCDKTGAVVLAWQFTDGSVPVDSGETLPRLAFYNGCLADPGPPTGEIVASSAPDPTDTTTGSSGWQYFPDPGMSRPQYTWQFNFDATGLVRGTCYSMYVEVPDTGQVIGSTEEGLEPFGPFFITPR
jgi:hypothetical protein